jgi:hypothetical protein
MVCTEYFVTNAETLECVLENCSILFYQGRIQSMNELLPLLEQIGRAAGPLSRGRSCGCPIPRGVFGESEGLIFPGTKSKPRPFQRLEESGTRKT